MKQNGKRLEGFETWALIKMLKISYLEHRTNEEVFQLAKRGRKLKADIITRKTKYFGHLVRGMVCSGVSWSAASLAEGCPL